jgi:hypothetical protein
VEKLGSGKLTVAEVLEPAIRLAEQGCVISAPLLSTKFINYLDDRVPVSEIHSLNASLVLVCVD